MRILIAFYIITVLSLVSDECASQVPVAKSVRLMFYNTENLFDPFDDSLKLDDDFTPQGSRHWTYDRFQDKLLKICRVIVSAGDWSSPPSLIGLCEVENSWVLHQLASETPLARYNYHFIHYDSPDSRGMDVAFLYNRDVFRVTGDKEISVPMKDKDGTTRDILYVRGLLWDSVEVHLFLNHWPSRWPGVGVSQPDRISAAGVLRLQVDSLFKNYQDPLVIIAGDFNDDKEDRSLSDCLGVKRDTSLMEHDQLYLLECPQRDGIYGTARYRSTWYEFDHVIVSGTLFISNLLRVMPAVKHIHHPDFLLENNETYAGFVPSRTYSGYRYKGGFSDHLPVYIDLQRR